MARAIHEQKESIEDAILRMNVHCSEIGKNYHNKIFSPEHTNIKISGRQIAQSIDRKSRDRRMKDALVSNIDEASNDVNVFRR